MSTQAEPGRPVARKVKGATAGAALGGTLAACIVWLLDFYTFNPGVEGDVPAQIEAVVLIVVPTLVTFIAGYQTRRV